MSMATPRFNSKSPTIKRILREAAELQNSPSPDYHASPASDSDLFEWHFTLRGPPSSAFADGIYHGRIALPPTYPLRPPSFRFLTPSGRFETNREICLSISGHHEETWQPAWGIRTALVALRSFMETDAKGQLGGLDMPEQGRKKIAESSAVWKCKDCGKSNGEILDECAKAAAELGEREDEKVPDELVLGTKADMEKMKSDREAAKDQDSEPAAPAPATVPAPQVPLAVPYPAARPAQTVPHPTGTVPIPQNQPHGGSPRNVVLARQHMSADGVSIWVDRAIGGIILCLAFLITKMIMGF